MMLRNIVLFRARFGGNRIAEFQAVFERMYPDRKVEWCWDKRCYLYRGGDYGPTLIQELPSVLSAQQWADIAVQCIGCRGVFQVVGEGSTLSECVQSVGGLSDSDILELIQGTWSIQFWFLGRTQHLHPKERTRRIESFRDVLGVLTQRKVQLENPDHELWLLEDHRILESAPVPTERNDALQYCGLWLRIKSTIEATARDLAELSDVKKRAFIHTTTMPSDRALLMANLGKVSSGLSVLDPFCGSGGLLLSASLLGANCVGADIDMALLCHREKPLPFAASPHRPLRGVEKVSYMDSFVELGLEAPKILMGLNIQDPSALQQFLQANQQHLYQVIVTDPPYGIREAISLTEDAVLIERLCEVAASVLEPKGRLVFLHVVECQTDIIESTQQELAAQMQKIAAFWHLIVDSCILERFNSKLWRATIVLELQNCTQ